MLEFAHAGAAVGATSATLEKTRILGAYFRTLDEDDLRRAAVYMSGRAFPPSSRRTLDALGGVSGGRERLERPEKMRFRDSRTSNR